MSNQRVNRLVSLHDSQRVNPPVNQQASLPGNRFLGQRANPQDSPQDSPRASQRDNQRVNHLVSLQGNLRVNHRGNPQVSLLGNPVRDQRVNQVDSLLGSLQPNPVLNLLRCLHPNLRMSQPRNRAANRLHHLHVSHQEVQLLCRQFRRRLSP